MIYTLQSCSAYVLDGQSAGTLYTKNKEHKKN